MVQNIIFAIVIIFLMAGAFFWMWKLSKWLLIPIQIVLFILLATVVVRTFVNKENAEKLNEELAKSGIAEVEKRAVSDAVDALKKYNSGDTATAEQPSQTVIQQENANSTAKDGQQTSHAAGDTQKPAAKSDVNFVDML